MKMRSPTSQEIDYMTGMMYIFQDERGYLYVNTHGKPLCSDDKAIAPFYFSQRERQIIKHASIFTSQRESQNLELFPEEQLRDHAIDPKEYMYFTLSRIIEILVKEGPDSPNIVRVPKRETGVKILFTKKMDFDPEKGKEAVTYVEQRVEFVKTRFIYVLRSDI